MLRSPLARLNRSSRSHGTPTATSRRRRFIRPSLEALEGRVVLNASALDTSFGTGGVVLTAPTDGSGLTDQGRNVAAVATQADGKIVTAETFHHPYDSAHPTVLLIRRYNADGSVDTNFGGNGQTNVPLPTGYASSSDQTPHDVVFGPDGGIAVGIDLYQSTRSGVNDAGVVARLTPTGRLDAGFGTDGVVILPRSLGRLGNIAVQADGEIVVTGSATGPSPGGLTPGRTTFAVARLTTSGAVDSSFNGTGVLTFSPGENAVVVLHGPQNIAVAPSGRIYVTDSIGFRGTAAGITDPVTEVTLVTRINANGTIDTSYGTGGTRASSLSAVNDLAVQADDKLILGGDYDGFAFSGLIRLNLDGSPDTTFQGFSNGQKTGISTRFPQVESLVLGVDGKITLLGGLFLARLEADGTPDPSFGTNGLEVISPNFLAGAGEAGFILSDPIHSLDLTSTGNLVVGGGNFLLQYKPITIRTVVNDFDGDGKTDIAAELPGLGIYAYRPSGGGSDVTQSFGQAGLGLTVPAPGDFDGDGISDIGAQLTDFANFAYRRTGAVLREYSGYGDTLSVSGTVGAGATIPATGDYDGDGITDRAVYLPASGAFEIKFSARPAATAAFGTAGDGRSIPAPGDYDGDGKTDLAVYLPSLGALAYRPSSGGLDQIIPFGQVGVGASIPTPGDYDGDGVTDISVYLPQYAVLAYRPSSGGPDVLESFGQVGDGASIPTPGDFDGDGVTDLAVQIPSLAQFIYRPSSGGADVIELFGIIGTGKTIPSASIPSAQPRGKAGDNARAIGSATPTPPVYIPLPADLTSPTPGKKKTGATA